jgi:hypothetical protein
MEYATWALNVMLSEAVVNKLQQGKKRGGPGEDRLFGDRGGKFGAVVVDRRSETFTYSGQLFCKTTLDLQRETGQQGGRILGPEADSFSCQILWGACMHFRISWYSQVCPSQFIKGLLLNAVAVRAGGRQEGCNSCNGRFAPGVLLPDYCKPKRA